MPDNSEKEKRKLLLNELQKKQDEEFEISLPMSKENFKLLFDYLDAELGEKECDDMHTLTLAFLKKTGLENSNNIIDWLKANGGFCDCEVLFNVEEKFV